METHTYRREKESEAERREEGEMEKRSDGDGGEKGEKEDGEIEEEERRKESSYVDSRGSAAQQTWA